MAMGYDSGNIFARILRGEIPASKVYEDDFVLAFRDIQPATPVHILVIPKGEFTSFNDFTAHEDAATIGQFFQTVRNIATQEGLSENGYRLISNHGIEGGQTVPHFHVHILGGRTLGKLVAD